VSPSRGPTSPGLDPHDYFSEGPYWWPDPKDPHAPYTRRDGERNPDRFDRHHDDLAAMSSALLSLGMGAALTGDRECSKRANEVASVWFVDAKTRMNPHLEHGQAIRGVASGRGEGIIDTVPLIYAVQGLALIDAAGELDRGVADGVRKWFADYLAWMRSSAIGREEQKSGNNHSTWWTAQAAAYAAFTGNAALQKELWESYRTFLVPHQIRPDGSCPLEEARTNSLHYSAYNLDAFTVLCRLARVAGVDLWKFRDSQGASVLGSIDYLLPFVERPAAWRKQEITPFQPDRIVFPGLAAIDTGSEKLREAYFALPRSLDIPWILWVDLTVRGLP
jgi:Alginate lyase